MSEPRSPGVRRPHREWLALGLLLLVLAAALVWARLRSHRDIDATEREQLEHQVAGLDRIVEMQLTTIRAAMRGVRDQLPGWPEVERPRSASQQFRTIETALAGVSNLQWLDAEGRVVAGSRADRVGSDASGRSGFRRARALPDPARLIVAEPVPTGAAGCSIDLAVPLVDGGGHFAGVIAATLDPAYFATVLASALYAADMRAAIVHGDGVALTWLPPDRAREGTDLAQRGSLYSRFRASGRSALVIEGRLFGTDETGLAAFHLLQPPALSMDKPLVLAVSRPVTAMFETWRRDTVAYALLYDVCAGAACAFLLAFQRRRVSGHRATLKALRESEHQLLTLTAALPGPVARFDRDGRYLFTNATCERWFGDPPSERLGRDWHDVFPAAVVAALDPPMRRALDGIAETFDATLPTQGGDRETMVCVVPDRDSDGVVQGCIVTLTDVTDRKRAEEALRQSEERSRSLLDALRSGVVVHGPDTRILDANPSACRILGRPREALIGLCGDDPFWQFLDEDETEMPRSQVPVRRIEAGGDPINDRMIGIRWGEPRGAVVWLLCSAFAVRDPAGALRQIVVTFVDVTERKAAQARLLQSEEEMRMASRLARLGGWRFDVASARITLSPELVALIGAGPDTLPADDFAPVLLPAERIRWETRLKRAIDDGLPIDEDFVARGANGRTAHWRVLGEAVRDAAGKMVAVQGAVQDVTDAREAQQQLRLLEAAVAGLNDAVLITEAEPVTGPGPRTVFVNDAYERMTGHDRAAVLGRSPRLLQGPETAGLELDRLREAMLAQQPVHVELVDHRRDGSRYWVEISMVPLFDGNGRATHFVAVQRDITERRVATAATLAAQRELAATLSAVPDLLFDVDLDGRIHQCHSPPKARFPVDPADVVGRRVAEVLPATAAETVMAALAEAHASGHSAGMQYALDAQAGRLSFELSVSGKPAPPGEPPRFIVLARDVSERRQFETQQRLLERQLREAQKMESIGTLAGGIAHDFNNILAAILGNLALARDEIADDHPAQATLGQIGKASVRARSLVQQILTFSRGQANPLRPRALRPIVEETLGLLRATLPAAVRLESRLAEEDLVVSTDATQLQQVLMNLCTNAWQALTGGRGRIEVGLEALDAGARIADLGTGPWAHLWVADDGAGMDALTRERIFDPFFTTKPVGKGTGLGLSVVHGIVRSHHATIAVETTLGKGSTFHLYFPLVGGAEGRDGDTGHAPLAARQVVTDSPAGPGGEHLLYVDDDEVMVLMVQRLLQRDGYRVTACSGALEALGLVARPASDFDLVISDFNMPEMSGLELAERLGRLQPQLPLIITSGYLTDELRDEARVLGVRALLQKERTLEELGGLVRRVLAGATLA